MHVQLDHHSGEPIYRQIVEQVKYAIAAGGLEGGEKLPSIRGLADELKVNPRTVVKAYEELQHAGLIVMQQGRGAFVRDGREGEPARVRRRVLSEMTRRLLAEAVRMGADRSELLEIVRNEAEEMEWKQ